MNRLSLYDNRALYLPELSFDAPIQFLKVVLFWANSLPEIEAGGSIRPHDHILYIYIIDENEPEYDYRVWVNILEGSRQKGKGLKQTKEDVIKEVIRITYNKQNEPLPDKWESEVEIAFKSMIYYFKKHAPIEDIKGILKFDHPF